MYSISGTPRTPENHARVLRKAVYGCMYERLEEVRQQR
jgi:hypothetical protein